MALVPFLPPPLAPAAPTAAQIANQIRSLIAQQGTQLFGTYTRVQALANADVLAALGTADATALQNYAAVVKAVINWAQPGKITDTVVAATITLPN